MRILFSPSVFEVINEDMYRERVGGSSKSEIVGGPLDRKRINDALDKHLEKSSPSTSKGLSSKDKERLSVPSTSTGKSQLDHRDTRVASLPKNKCSDGQLLFSLVKSFCYLSTVKYGSYVELRILRLVLGDFMVCSVFEELVCDTGSWSICFLWPSAFLFFFFRI